MFRLSQNSNQRTIAVSREVTSERSSDEHVPDVVVRDRRCALADSSPDGSTGAVQVGVAIGRPGLEAGINLDSVVESATFVDHMILFQRVEDTELETILQVLSNTGKVDDNRDFVFIQLRTGSEAGELDVQRVSVVDEKYSYAETNLEELRSLINTGGNDDFVFGGDAGKTQ